jgi:hypothetical protein
VTDSLTRLVLRARGQLPTAEPLLPSRYAPAGAAPVPDGESPATLEAEAPASPPTGSRTPRVPAPAAPREYGPRADRATAPADPLVKEVPERVPAQQRIEQGRQTPHAAGFANTTGQTPGSPELVAQAITSRTGSPEFVEVSPEAQLRHSAPAVAAAPVSNRPADNSGVAQALSEPAGAASHMTPPAARPASSIATERLWLPDAPARMLADESVAVPPDFPVRQIQAAAPDVQISIGVIEVHAAPPRRPAPARTAPAPPRVSLADYLAQRRARLP